MAFQLNIVGSTERYIRHSSVWFQNFEDISAVGDCETVLSLVVLSSGSYVCLPNYALQDNGEAWKVIVDVV